MVQIFQIEKDREKNGIGFSFFTLILLNRTTNWVGSIKNASDSYFSMKFFLLPFIHLTHSQQNTPKHA